MRLSSRLSDENEHIGEVEAIIDLNTYAAPLDEDEESPEDEDRIRITDGDFIEIQIGTIVLSFYSAICDDSVSFIAPSHRSPKKLHCLIVNSKTISIDCQLTCADFNSNDEKCKGCSHCIQAWFLIEADDIFSNRPIVKVIRKTYELPEYIKIPVEASDKYSEWIAKADLAHKERLGAGAAIYLRSVFETIVKEIGAENGIIQEFIDKRNKKQYRNFEQYLESVDSVCKIIPDQYSKNGYELFRKLSNIAHGHADEETAVREYDALKRLVVGIVENVKKQRDEIRNNNEIQKALQEIGFSDRGVDDE